MSAEKLDVTEAGKWTVVTGDANFRFDEVCRELRDEGIDHFIVHDLSNEMPGSATVARIESEHGYQVEAGKISVAFEKTGLKPE